MPTVAPTETSRHPKSLTPSVEAVAVGTGAASPNT